MTKLCECGHAKKWHKENGMSIECRKPSCEFGCSGFKPQNQSQETSAKPSVVPDTRKGIFDTADLEKKIDEVIEHINQIEMANRIKKRLGVKR